MSRMFLTGPSLLFANSSASEGSLLNMRGNVCAAPAFAESLPLKSGRPPRINPIGENSRTVREDSQHVSHASLHSPGNCLAGGFCAMVWRTTLDRGSSVPRQRVETGQ